MNRFDYEVIEPISEGKSSRVFLACRPTGEADSAGVSDKNEPDIFIVKVIPASSLPVIEKISKVESEHLPKILGYDVDGDELTVFEEYIEGKNIDEYAEGVGSADGEIDLIISLILQICDGLKILHSLNPPIIHRDLKPSNIIVNSEGVVKIIDFDASREYDSKKSKDTQVLGTESYAPPEQFGYSQTDVRSDIYSLGVLMQELVKRCGVDASASSGRLSAIIEKCTMFNPDARYADTDELKNALERYLRNEDVQTDNVFSEISGRDEGANSKRIIIAFIACFLGIGIGLFLYSIYTGNNKDNTSENKAESTALATETPEPTATPYTGEVGEISIDTVDPRTGEQVLWTYYYYTGECDYVQDLRVTSFTAKNKKVDKIQIRSDNSIYTDVVDPKYWHQDENDFICIDEEFIRSLEKDVVYTLAVDLITDRLSFQVCVIDDLEKVENTRVSVVSGYAEYIRSEGEDIVCYAEDTFGRKLDKIVDFDTKKELDKSYYEYDESTGKLTILQKLFDDKKDGDYLNYAVIFEKGDVFKKKELKEDLPLEYANPMVTICVRDVPYIRPVFKKSSFIMTEDTDIDVKIEFNSAKGKLEFISMTSEDDDKPKKLDPSDYEINDDGIVLKKSYLKKLSAGEYSFTFEFGEIAKTVSVNKR